MKRYRRYPRFFMPKYTRELSLAGCLYAKVCKRTVSGRLSVCQSMQEKLPVAGSLYCHWCFFNV